MSQLLGTLSKVAGGLVAGALFISIGTASADPGKAGTPAASQDFAAQARDNGLSDTQAQTLQREVDSNLARLGGTQVAINKIEFYGGGLVLALPGEKYARDLTIPGNATATAQSVLAPPTCFDGDLCLYSGAGHTGNYRYYYACQTVPMPWFGLGSYNDNQFTGTITIFYNVNGTTTRITAKVSHNINWTPIYQIKVC